MANQVKILKIDATYGLPIEHDGAADELTFLSYTAALAGGFNVTTGCAITNNISFNAVTDTIAGIQNQNLVDKTDTESITGNWSLGASGELDCTSGELTFPNAVSAVPASGDTYWDGDTLYAYDDTLDIWRVVGGQGSTAESIDKPFTYGEILVAGNCVCITAADTVSKARANNDTLGKPIGFVVTGGAAAATGMVRQIGIIGGLTLSAAGVRYFLSAATPGAITSTPPTGAGNRVIQVGIAKNTTDLDIQIQFMGVRS